MIKWAVVPSVDEQLDDRYFMDEVDVEDMSTYFAHGIKKEINKRGDEIHTIDYYANPSEIDYVLLDWPRWDWICKLQRMGLLSRTFYCNAEPTSVIEMNCPTGYKKLKKLFPVILTWNRDWVDSERIFRKNIPYFFKVDFGNIDYEGRKLLTAITADKKSNTPGELYSERRNVYTFFEKNHPSDFDFYGVRWNEKEHPCYKGTVEDKFQTYHNYKFAICLENTKGAKDYVTEKIYDCLCAGIVPIYGGTPNIEEYVPSNCFIDYFSFDSYEEMAQHLMSMTKEEYMGYLKNIRNWLNTMDKYPVSMERYVELMYLPTENRTSLEDSFSLGTGMLVYAYFRTSTDRLKTKLVDIKHRLLN